MNNIIVMSSEESLDLLERRVEIGLRNGMDAMSAMREIRDRELWKGKHQSFEDYCFARFSIEPTHTKRLLNLKLPERLEQREIWHAPQPAVSPTALADLSVRLEQARKQSGDVLVDMVRQEEESIRAEAKAASDRFKMTQQTEYVNQFIAKIRWCVKVSKVIGLEEFTDTLKACLDKVKGMETE